VEAIPPISSPNKTCLLRIKKKQQKLYSTSTKVMRGSWTFLDFYRNAVLIKHFTNNQYYVTELNIQRINLDFKYVILPIWEKTGYKSPCVPSRGLTLFSIFFLQT
jgi:hypothetical protein